MNNKAINDVLNERLRQDEKWGEQNHNIALWNAILAEEYGEFAKEVVESMFRNEYTDNLRTEAVQCAAVALAIIEYLDRQQDENNVK